jgi:hypothetical protein
MSREGRLALALAGLAGLRVLAMSLAFPFFTNVDEYRHLDVVLKYARGELGSPGPQRYEDETARLVGAWASPEYHRDPDASEPVPPPPWRQPDAVREARIAHMREYLGPRWSLEAGQPPLYYAAAGAWLAAGRACGLTGIHLLYFVRLLGTGAAFATVLAAWWGLRPVYPGSAFVRLGVPALLAVLPQDCLYYVTGDAFSPLLGGLAFLLTLRLLERPDRGAAAFSLAGLAGAAAFLTKYPNVAVWAGCALLCALAVSRREARAPAPGGPAFPAARWALYWAALLLPALLWLGRNLWLGADAMGTAFKVEKLGWGRKPAGELFAHPLFTPSGAWTFVRDTLPRFWRGELVWERLELAWPAADRLYVATSLLFGASAAAGLLRRGRARLARSAEAAALLASAAGLAVLSGLSLLFVFGESTSPSAGYPFFVQGRLVSGVLVPFALVYVRGIEVLTEGLPARLAAPAAWSILACVAGVALGSELLLTREVFQSAYNGFHLP